MEADFWHERWREGRIGFHQAEPNPLLRKFWPPLASPRGQDAEVFVPLCGKSLDMNWLAATDGDSPGHRVIGVELSDIAVRGFFQDRGLTQGDIPGTNTFTVETEGEFDVYRHDRIEIWCGDFFAFPAARLRETRLAYDRASLIALPPDMRQAYARKLSELLRPDARTLLLTLTYGEGEVQGPPFSVTDEEVEALYGATHHVTRLEIQDAMAGSQNLKDRGARTATTTVFVVGPAKS